MSQVLSINLDSNQAEEAMNLFLMRWESIDCSSSTEGGYELVLKNGKSALLSVEGGELTFQGEFDDHGLEIIKTIADSYGSKLLLEGEVLEQNNILQKWNDVGFIGKSLAIIGGLLVLPIAIILLPVLLIVAIVRLGITLIIGGKHGIESNKNK